MRQLFVVIVLLHSLPLFAQQVRMEAGNIYLDNAICARYEEVGEKKQTLPFAGEQADYNPESTGSNFHDFIFRTNDGEQIAFATARVLAAPGRGRLVYYYSIQFGTMETELNVEYHPYAINTLAGDIVKYKLIKDGHMDEEAAMRLIRAWNKKSYALDEKQLVIGSRCNYNNSPYHIASELDKTPITIQNHNIYLKDSIIATYELAKTIVNGLLPGTGKGDFYFYLFYPDGKPLADMQLVVRDPYIRIWPAPEKNYFKVYTAEREEENLIKVTVLSLLNRQQPIAGNKQ